MSKIGKKPIEIPAGTEVKIEGDRVEVKGPKGTLAMNFLSDKVSLESGEGILRVVKKNGKKNEESGKDANSAFWGLTRSLLNNMVLGVTQGFEKKLELQGVGFRMSIQGRKINMALGFSHPVEKEIPEGVEAKVEENNVLVISGIDKQKVGQFASEIYSLKKVEPYKGKGFRYAGEKVRRKAGKKAASGK